MYSLREFYRFGNGPSSSHTIGPQRAATTFRDAHPAAASYLVTLYGSLAATGKGHMTDVGITRVLAPVPVEFVWKPEASLPEHPNGMEFIACDAEGAEIGRLTEYSTGGGTLLSDSMPEHLYKEASMTEIMLRCRERGESFWEYVERNEGQGIWDFLSEVWDVMKASVRRGLDSQGKLPGQLGIQRRAKAFHRRAMMIGDSYFRTDALLAAYAHAAAEENAAGGVVVTAPTCGSCGVLPAVLFFLDGELSCSHDDIVHALATAGLVGNIVKQNGSISGAAVGCQGEIGTACSMAAAAMTQLQGGTLPQIEYAAEMGLEHHLGLTCDPVGGLVQIPCIERNAHAAARALSCSNFSMLSDGLHWISFDNVVAVMVETGRALPSMYRETSTGGLALVHRRKIAE
jgi:L-serine dehydratase